MNLKVQHNYRVIIQNILFRLMVQYMNNTIFNKAKRFSYISIVKKKKRKFGLDVIRNHDSNHKPWDTFEVLIILIKTRSFLHFFHAGLRQ